MAFEAAKTDRISIAPAALRPPFPAVARKTRPECDPAARRSSTGGNDVKRLFPIFLSTAAICAGLSATPAAAQVTGNARAAHTQNQAPYPLESDRMQEYTASVADPDNAGCSVIHDFNTSQTHYAYIAVCPFFPLH